MIETISIVNGHAGVNPSQDQRPLRSDIDGPTIARVMDVYFDTLASATERSEVERWCTTHESTDIEYISIDKPAVFVHGCKDQFVAVTGRVRRRGELTGELTAALAVMRRDRDRGDRAPTILLAGGQSGL